MKKPLLLLLVFSLVFPAAVFAQDDARNVPTVVLNAFSAKYKGMKVKDWDWEDDKNLYEAEFMMNGREHEAYFSPDGTWKKTKIELKKDQVPVAVSKGLASSDYGTWKAKDFMEMDSPDEGRVYKMKVEKGSEEYYLKFDSSGKLLDRKSKSEKKEMKKKY